MKIKLAIIDPDSHFLSKISLYYSLHHAGDLNVSTYSTVNSFASTQSLHKFDLLWVNPEMEGAEEVFQGANNLVYISESKSIVSIHHLKAICKYQKPEIIYKKLLQVYSESENSQKFGFAMGDSLGSNLILVEGLSGGVGTTSVACAICRKLSESGKNVLYFNPEAYNSTTLLFSGEGEFGLSDLLYSFKSNRGNFGLKIKSFEKHDSSGVVFFDGWNMPTDRFHTSDADIIQLLKAILELKIYDYIIFDGALSDHSQWLQLSDSASACVWVFDQSLKSDLFLGQRLNLYKAYATEEVADLLPKTFLLANKCTQAYESQIEIPFLAKVPYIPNADFNDLLLSIVKKIDLSHWK